MGFFSKIFDAVKNVFKRVLGAIAKFFSKVFGSPLIAALAMFIVSWMCAGFPIWAMFMNNPVLFLLEYPALCAAALNVVMQVVASVVPSFRPVVAKIMGCVSFILLAVGVVSYLQTDQLFNSATYLSNTFGIAGESAFYFESYFTFVSMLTTYDFVSGMAAGVDSDYINAWIDGFMAVPGAVADVADAAVEGVTDSVSSFLVWVGLGLGVYWLATRPATPKDRGATVVNVAPAQPAMLSQEGGYIGS